MDPDPSMLVSISNAIGSSLSTVLDLFRNSAVLIIISSAVVAISTRILDKAADEITTKGVKAAEFFRFIEK